MNKFSQKVELAANVLIIITIVLIGTLVTQRYFFAKPFPTPAEAAEIKPTVGAKIDVPDVNWADKSKTLILALNKGCHFCNESAPFYKRLIESAKNENVKFVAVFPSEVKESQAHLKELGIPDIDVKQAPLAALQVSGTPTLILTDNEGKITDYWVGKLPPEKEAEVFSKLNLK